MKTIEYMSDLQLLGWTFKTKESIRSYISAGGEMKRKRGYELLDRYEGLRKELQHRYVDSMLWKKYCRQSGSDTRHTGYDLFA